jgi:hypothetical protein
MVLKPIFIYHLGQVQWDIYGIIIKELGHMATKEYNTMLSNPLE